MNYDPRRLLTFQEYRLANYQTLLQEVKKLNKNVHEYALEEYIIYLKFIGCQEDTIEKHEELIKEKHKSLEDLDQKTFSIIMCERLFL